MIIAVGFKVNNQRAVRFRVWANQIVEQYTIKGWAMDEERLKNGGTVLTKKYFEEQWSVSGRSAFRSATSTRNY